MRRKKGGLGGRREEGEGERRGEEGEEAGVTIERRKSKRQGERKGELEEEREGGRKRRFLPQPSPSSHEYSTPSTCMQLVRAIDPIT